MKNNLGKDKTQHLRIFLLSGRNDKEADLHFHGVVCLGKIQESSKGIHWLTILV